MTSVSGGEEQSQARDERLLSAGMTLASELSLPGVLQRIVDLAVEICEARYGALGVLGVDGATIEEFITTGLSEAEIAAIGHPPVGRGILGVLITDRMPLRLPDITTDERGSGFPPGHPPMHSFLGAPVTARGVVFGNIYLTDKIGSASFTDQDERDLIILAAQAGVAIENARLYEEALAARRDLERLAVMEDRERIARELHDGAIQSLFAVGMGLQGAATSSGSEETSERIQQAVDEIDRVIRDLRNYIFGLRPGILADRQLDQAIRELAEDLEAKSGVVTIVEIDSEVAASLSSWAGDIVQLVREALSNVGRHADAATCRVSLLREGETTAALAIDDDGSGVPASPDASGNGLVNMRDRAARLGGQIVINAVPGEGTTVVATLPLR